MANQKIRINLKSFDNNYFKTVDRAKTIVLTAEKTGAKVSGPIPLPTKKEVVTILRAVHKYKDSREQFEVRTHKRLIDVMVSSKETMDALMNLELPAGVDIKVDVK